MPPTGMSSYGRISGLLCGAMQQDRCMGPCKGAPAVHLNFSPFFLPRGLAVSRFSSTAVASTSITAPLLNALDELEAAVQ